MQPRFVLATHNAHKITELRAILTAINPDFPVADLAAAGDFYSTEPVEDGDSFIANALIKARHAATATGLPAFADDSGLSVDIMGGAPGIFSARWCGHHGDDKANLELLLGQLAEVPQRLRGAAFCCAAALVLPDGREASFMGQVRGTLRSSPSGAGGFGYDPIFVPTGYDCTMAELSAQEKNQISHRFRAFAGLAETSLCQELTHNHS